MSKSEQNKIQTLYIYSMCVICIFCNFCVILWSKCLCFAEYNTFKVFRSLSLAHKLILPQVSFHTQRFNLVWSCRRNVVWCCLFDLIVWFTYVNASFTFVWLHIKALHKDKGLRSGIPADQEKPTGLRPEKKFLAWWQLTLQSGANSIKILFTQYASTTELKMGEDKRQ